MSTITKISVQQKDRGRLNVYMDGTFAFSLSEDVVLSRGLRNGDELSNEQISEILNEDLQSKILSKTLDFISYQLRTEREVKDKVRALLVKYIPDESLWGEMDEKVLGRVKTSGLIDDLGYAKAYVAGKLLAKSVPGKFKVQQYLTKKGVSREVINEALEGYGGESEIQGAQVAADRKLKTLKGGTGRERKAKLWRFLAGRGYSSDVIRAVVDTKSDID